MLDKDFPPPCITGKIQSNLNGKLNLHSIAVGGHSYGGATAILTSHNDSRIRTCFVLDGWINPLPDSVKSVGISVPILFIGRPSWSNSDYPTNYLELNDLLMQSSNKKYELHIKNTLHLDYTDIPLMSPLVEYVMDVGSLPASTTIPLINNIVYHFLQENLLEKKSNKLDLLINNQLINKL